MIAPSESDGGSRKRCPRCACRLFRPTHRRTIDLRRRGTDQPAANQPYRGASLMMDIADLKLAMRNTVRHGVRSAIAISAISFSVVALLLAGGFIEWIFWATRENVIQTGMGHIRAVKPGYLESGVAEPFSYLLPATSAELSALEAVPEVKGVAPRLSASGLISH